MFDKEIFSKRLSLLRAERNVSQLTVAEASGIKRSTYTLLESGSRAPSIDVFYALCDFFGVSADYLLGRSDDPRMLP
jgi:transcriptional regulator with XRE-family HTH domain